MKIACDTNQLTGSHAQSNETNHRRFMELGHGITPLPLPFGDYTEITPEIQEIIDRRGEKLGKMDLMLDIKVAVDRKRNLDEVSGNICGRDHDRFREEAIRAQKAGARFCVLVENDDGIADLNGVKQWSNPRMHRYNKIKYMHRIGKWDSVPLPKRAPTASMTLFKSMYTMSKKYGVEWVFCKPSEAAEKIVKLLSGEE